MAETGERSIGRELSAWVQMFGIIIATTWGVYTFVYKEIVVPKSAPVNITVNLDLKKVGTGDLERGLIPVEIRISAKNPSSRAVYLLPSVWIAYGLKIVAADRVKLIKEVPAIASRNPSVHVLRHARTTEEVVVGYGTLITDTSLKPSETTTRTLILYVPRDTYDIISVVAAIPTVGKKKALDMEWNLNENSQTLDPTIYRLNPKGGREEMQRNEDGSYTEEKLDLQVAKSEAEMSLWQ